MNSKRRLVLSLTTLLALVTVFSFELSSVRAQELPEATASGSTVEVKRKGIRAIVRGLYVESHAGGGYATGRPVTDDRFNTGLRGTEGDGASVMIGMNFGYDVSDTFSLQLMTSLSLVSSTRRKKIRDLSIGFAGAAARMAFPLSDRLHMTVLAGAGFASVSNAVDPVAKPAEGLSPEELDTFYATSSTASGGPAIIGGFGLEYFVHVRHFSVGVQLTTLVPVRPFRIAGHLAPFVKYTF